MARLWCWCNAMTQDAFEFLFNIVFPFVMLVIFYFIGRSVERRHLRRLDEQEAALSHIVVHELKSLPSGWTVTAEPMLVYGSVVLANDYFKMFISSLKKIVGGHLREYERLVERGRREAIIRMKQMAADNGYNVVWNMRIETSMLADGKRGGATSAELYAYGTAMFVQQAP